MTLTPGQVRQYREQGCLFPLRALPAAHAEETARRILAVDVDDLKRRGIRHPWLYKCYLLFTWIDDIVRTPVILDAVESLIGPDLLVMSADIWVKPAHEPRMTSWHQDANYWFFDPPEVMTAWIALNPATPQNGCMRFMPGTHRVHLDHIETFDKERNMLSRGQTVALEIDETQALIDALVPGEMSIHHALLAHASGPNTTDAPRIGLAIRYFPAAIRSLSGPLITGMLVRGRDHGHFALEQPPLADLTPEAIAEHHQALEPHAASQFVHM
ncbi:MAG: phytanoyl-CoA dioxygenase family protein [Rhodospirillales bacterium]|nr:phytanoyl-CoA dioxygenase family protein [Rhodospirillales bacterium]